MGVNPDHSFDSNRQTTKQSVKFGVPVTSPQRSDLMNGSKILMNQ